MLLTTHRIPSSNRRKVGAPFRPGAARPFGVLPLPPPFPPGGPAADVPNYWGSTAMPRPWSFTRANNTRDQVEPAEEGNFVHSGNSANVVSVSQGAVSDEPGAGIPAWLTPLLQPDPPVVPPG